MKFQIKKSQEWIISDPKQDNSVCSRIISLFDLKEKEKKSGISFPHFPSEFSSPYTFFDLARDTINDYYWLKDLDPSLNIYVYDTDEQFSKMDIYANINRLLRAMVMRNELQGGFLIHGIMLQHKQEDRAIIYAGDSGVGKTTAAQKMPSDQWQRCSDDVTLVVRDNQGLYYAHPWSGSKSYMQPELRYGAEKGVLLMGVFFLKQHSEVQIETAKKIESIAVLQRLVNEHAALPDPSIDPKRVGEMRKNRLVNLVSFSRSVPIYNLYLNKTDPFWRDIEALLYDDDKK